MTNERYKDFVAQVNGGRGDPLPADKEFAADDQEIGWWKQHQVKRAIGKMRRGKATPVDLSLIENKTNIIPPAIAKRRIKGRV